MSYAPASTKPNVNTPAGRLAAAQESVKANQTAGAKFDTAGQAKNAGSGFGAGRVSFDKQGNTLQDGKIVQFAGRQARQDFLSRQGLGNNGVIVDQAKFANADFSSLANYNIVGNKLEQPYLGENIILTNAFLERSHPGVKPDSQKSNPPQIAQFGNYGQAKLAPDNFYRGSTREDQVKKAEADRATKIYQSTSNQDYLTGGKPQGDKVEFVPPEGFHYFNMGQGILGSEINKGTKEEQNAKATAAKKAEADRVSSLFYPQQPEYGGGDVFITGGPKNLPTPESGGVITGKSLGKNYGSAWTNAQLGTTQIYGGNTPKEQAKITSQGKEKSLSKEDQLSLNNNLISADNSVIGINNGIIRMENRQIAKTNLAQDKAFRDRLHQEENQGGSFEIFLNSNKVKESSGARTYYDILAVQHNAKPTDQVTYSVTYPQKEQALTTAVKKNPEYFLNLPPNYWNTLSKSGFVSEKNIGTITSTLDKQYNADIHSSAIGLIRGAKKAGESSITIFDSSGMLGIHPYEEPRPKGYLPLNAKTIGESLKQNANNPNIQYGVTSQENEVASFLKTPFMGKKVSTSTIPSTSYADVLQFFPALGSKELALASRGLERIVVEKGAPIIRDVGIRFKNKANQEVLKRVQPAIPTEPTYDWFPARTRPTFRNTNPMRTPLPKDIFSKDTFTPKPREPGSASPLIPFTPQTIKEGPMKTTGIEKVRTFSSIPETEKITPPSTSISKVQTDMFGRPYVSGLPAIRTTSTFSNEAANVQPFVSSEAPIKSKTNVSDIFGSKTSRANPQYLFTGSFPQNSYFPLAKNVESPREKIYGLFRSSLQAKQNPSYYQRSGIPLELMGSYSKAISQQSVGKAPDVFGAIEKKKLSKSQKPETNLEPRKDYQDWRFENYLKKASTEGKFGFSIKGKSEKPDVSFNVGGNKIASPLETGEKNYPEWKFENYLKKASTKGKFGFSVTSKSEKPEVYQYGNKFPRGSLQNKDVGLVKFEKYQKAHPEPQKTGPEARIESFFKNLPTRSTKAAVSQNELFKSKDIKIGFRRTSNKTFEEPKAKGKEVKSSSGQISIQIAKEEQAKPLSRTRRRAGLLSESQFDYLYEHTPVPKERVTSTSGLKSLSEFGTTTIFANRSATRQNERNFLNIKVKPTSREKLGSKLSSRSNSKLANDLMPKVGNILANKQSPKSGQKPKQAQKMPTPQLPKQPQSPAFKFKPFETTKPIHRQPPKPPKKPPGLQFWGAGNKQGKKTTKGGPTALLNLGVKGIFTSSFNIKGGNREF